MPERVQRKRTKGWKMPPNTVYVGRPSRFGNPCYEGMFKGYTHEDAVRDHARWLARDLSGPFAADKPPSEEEIVVALHGMNLACWCPLDRPCHADTLLKIANG